MRWRRGALGLAVAIGVVGLFVYGVGWETVLEHVREAHPAALATALVVGFGMLALRGLVVKRLLAPVDGAPRGVSFTMAFLSGYFARSALPWGRSTGTPIMAYLLANNSESEFEDNLAVVAAAEGFNVVASLVVAGVGFAFYVLALGGDSDDTLATSVAMLTGGGLLAASLVAIVFHRGVARAVTFEVASRLEASVGRLPWLSRLEGTLTARIDGFFQTLEEIQASQRTLTAAFALAVMGWLFNAAPLYFCLLALGVDVPFALVMVCAPLASFGGVVPLPGGSGGIEVVLASLLVATAGVSAGLATAAAILYRLTTYWSHLVIGGCGAIYLSLSPSGRT